jgi:hypothetical protein
MTRALQLARLALAGIASAVLAGCAMNADVSPATNVQSKVINQKVTMDVTVTIPSCQLTGAGSVTATCLLQDSGTPGNRTVVFSMSGLGAGDGIAGPPVAVFQLPVDAHLIAGTFNNQHGTAGNLVIDAGHAELPMDAGNNIIAEAGMQLVVVSFPPNTPPDTYFLVFSYHALSSTKIKAMLAAQVKAANRTYYPSLAPCGNRFTALPNVPIPQTPIETRIDISGIAAVYVPCAGKAYAFDFAAAVPVTVVEYYNAVLDHYFITWVPDEIAILDAGVQIRGWVRTGKSFKTYAVVQPGTSDICRFYIPPGKGDSHFFGRGITECENTAAAHPDFDEESSTFMFMFLPVNGACPAGTVAVYRVFDNRPDANHRYMIDRATRDQMVALGWLAEGDGPDLIVMCAPA